MTDEQRALLQRAYNALCAAEHELGEIGFAFGAPEFRQRIGVIRAELAVVAFPHPGRADG